MKATGKSLNMTPEQQIQRRYQFEMHQRSIKCKSYWTFKFWFTVGRHIRDKYEIEL